MIPATEAVPTYEYRCPEGHEFEHFSRHIKDAATSLPCPACGKPAARRISAGGGLLFKGSGFYITDYGKDGKKDQRPAGGAASQPASGHDAAKPTDSPPAGAKKPGGSDPAPAGSSSGESSAA